MKAASNIQVKQDSPQGRVLAWAFLSEQHKSMFLKIK